MDSNAAPVNESAGPVTFAPANRPLAGTVGVPGDKSISHRAVLLSAVSEGPVEISGFLRSADTLATVAAVRQLGVAIRESGDQLIIHGSGWEGLSEPEDVLDVANAGTLIRLLPGLIVGTPHFVVLTGDASIRRRPMGRVAEPLRAMGAMVTGRANGRFAPLALRGGSLTAIEHAMPVSSAQVKSCLLLAGLRAEGDTTVLDPGVSRDHTERMLAYGGVDVRRETHGAGEAVTVGRADGLRLGPITVPGDPSSAAFLVAAGALVPGSEVTVTGVGLNPSRISFFHVLQEMGAGLEMKAFSAEGPEPVGDIRIHGDAALSPFDVGPAEVPGLIDEIPVWALLAARAEGTSRLRGAAELRVKESDRLRGTAELLRTIGVEVFEYEDGLDIVGRGSRWPGGRVAALDDHRLAMVGAVAGLASTGGVTVDDMTSVDVSFPGFAGAIDSLRTDEHG